MLRSRENLSLSTGVQFSRLAVLLALSGCAASATPTSASSEGDAGSTVDSNSDAVVTTDTSTFSDIGSADGSACDLHYIRVRSNSGASCREGDCSNVLNLSVLNGESSGLEVDAPLCIREGERYGTSIGPNRYSIPVHLRCMPTGAAALDVDLEGSLGADPLEVTTFYKWRTNRLGEAIRATWPANFVQTGVPCTFTALGRSVTEPVDVDLQVIEQATNGDLQVTDDHLQVRFQAPYTGRFIVDVLTEDGVSVFPATADTAPSCGHRSGWDITPLTEARTCNTGFTCAPDLSHSTASFYYVTCSPSNRVGDLQPGQNQIDIQLPMAPSTAMPRPYQIKVVGINNGYNGGTLFNDTINY